MRFLAFGLLLLCSVAGDGQAVRPPGAGKVEPPFGRKWGEPPTGLVDWAARFKLDVHVKAPGDRPRVKILMVAPRVGSLPNHESTSLEAHFIDGRLFEVSVHYTYPGESTDHVRARHAALKELLTRHYGPLKFNGRKNDTQDGITTLSEAFQAEPSPGNMLLLVFTEVRDAKRGDAAARFSVLYHNEGILDGR